MTDQSTASRSCQGLTEDDVRASGILARVPKPGEPAPDFTLANQAGQSVSLEALRSRGPVVLSFYRGRW